MTIYSTGTVSVTNGSAVVTGSGTAWAVALIAGGIFSTAGVSVPILSVDSDTSLTLAYNWPGTTASGAVYAIARENSEAADIVDLNDKLSRVLVTLSLAGITPNASGTIAERDALTLAVGDKGFLWWEISGSDARAALIPTPSREMVSVAFDGPPNAAELEVLAAASAGKFVRIRWQIDEEHKQLVDRKAIEAV